MDKPVATPIVYRFEQFRLDKQGRQLTRLGAQGGAVPVLLGARALDILLVLVEHSGKVVSKPQIMDAVWPKLAVEESNLTVQITALRRALDDGRHEPSLIQTVHARGYILTALATRAVAPPPGAPPSEILFAMESATDAQKGPYGLPLSGSLPAATAADLSRPAKPTANVPETTNLSLIVLPFENFGGGGAGGYLADCITEDLTTGLARIPSLSVIERHMALTLKGDPIDVRRLGRELGVRYVVQGSTRRIGELVRVSVQLVNTQLGLHVWADRFDTDRTDSAEVCDEITGRLVRTVHLAVRAANYHKTESKDLMSVGVPELVDRGWATRKFISRDYIQTSLNYFERALTVDPESTGARVGTAYVLLGTVAEGWSTSAEQDLQRAEQLLLDAFGHGADDNRAHLTMGLLRRLQNRLSESQIALEAAIALDPNSPGSLVQLGIVLLYMGQLEAAILKFEKAIRLNPQDPAACIAYSMLGYCRILLDEPDAAIGDLRRACAAVPGLWYGNFLLAAALGLKEEIGPAKAALAEAVRLKPQVISVEWLRAVGAEPRHPRYKELVRGTMVVGLRRAGVPV